MKTKLSTSSDAGMNKRQARTRSMIASLPLLFSIAFLIFAGCAGPTSTQTTPLQQTPTAQSIPASPASTPQLTQQYEFKEQDSGRTVTFTVTSRFQIILDQHKYPKKPCRFPAHLQRRLAASQTSRRSRHRFTLYGMKEYKLASAPSRMGTFCSRCGS